MHNGEIIVCKKRIYDFFWSQNYFINYDIIFTLVQINCIL